jgi:hypothetical protein
MTHPPFLFTVEYCHNEPYCAKLYASFTLFSALFWVLFGNRLSNSAHLPRLLPMLSAMQKGVGNERKPWLADRLFCAFLA